MSNTNVILNVLKDIDVLEFGNYDAEAKFLDSCINKSSFVQDINDALWRTFYTFMNNPEIEEISFLENNLTNEQREKVTEEFGNDFFDDLAQELHNALNA